MTNIVVVLQNAWSPLFAGGHWPRRSWLIALKRSRTGQRLVHMIDDLDLCEESTPIVGATPSSIVPPDENHIKEFLSRRSPEIVVACGKQAEKVMLKLWTGPLLVVPHPTSRVVTNVLYKQARILLTSEFVDRVALRQTKSGISKEPLI